MFLTRIRRTQERRLRFSTLLPSEHTGLAFTAALTIGWHLTDDSTNGQTTGERGSLLPAIRQVVRERASELTPGCCLLDPARAEDAVLATLSHPQNTDHLPGACWRITRAHLTSSKQDRVRAAREHTDMSTEHARLHRSQARLDAMRDVMTDPATLAAWWLRRVPLTDLPADATATALAGFSRAIAALPPPAQSHPPEQWLARLAGWFWSELDPSQREHLLDSLIELARLYKGDEWSAHLSRSRASRADHQNRTAPTKQDQVDEG
ncbi:hypothetical protein ABZ863_27080 [Saccharomonospora sp. NPDC046836]|uniref:hypothetical protein n=1 Tax=Saccharomonospora sp. NPDC046836 TaxID=3156921 RepID=UPI0033F83414